MSVIDPCRVGQLHRARTSARAERGHRSPKAKVTLSNLAHLGTMRQWWPLPWQDNWWRSSTRTGARRGGWEFPIVWGTTYVRVWKSYLLGSKCGQEGARMALCLTQQQHSSHKDLSRCSASLYAARPHNFRLPRTPQHQ